MFYNECGSDIMRNLSMDILYNYLVCCLCFCSTLLDSRIHRCVVTLCHRFLKNILSYILRIFRRRCYMFCSIWFCSIVLGRCRGSSLMDMFDNGCDSCIVNNCLVDIQYNCLENLFNFYNILWGNWLHKCPSNLFRHFLRSSLIYIHHIFLHQHYK